MVDTVKQEAHKRDESWHMNPRAVSVIDYQEYRKLEEKQNRILLKRELYDRKKVNDENQVLLLNEELNHYQ